MKKNLPSLIKTIKQCTLCAEHFEHKPRPVVQLSNKATILIAGQAPGRKVQASGIPFDDASGDRLRSWMGISRTLFYDANKIAILPMGFCYPGHGKSGDLPPRKECAATWRQQVLDAMPNIQLTIVIGAYAIDWHLKDTKKHNLTETIKSWKDYNPKVIPLIHPSPRNNIWLSKNPWFEEDILPVLRTEVSRKLSRSLSENREPTAEKP